MAGGDPDLGHAMGVGINRTTASWNAAASLFAYAFATLAERGYLFVGQDQLVGGTWPDNEPAVTMLDWQSGEPNAKYWVTRLLAATVGSTASKQLHPISTGSDPSQLYALAYTLLPPARRPKGGAEEAAAPTRGVLLINKRRAPATATLRGVSGGLASCVEVGAGLAACRVTKAAGRRTHAARQGSAQPTCRLSPCRRRSPALRPRCSASCRRRGCSPWVASRRALSRRWSWPATWSSGRELVPPRIRLFRVYAFIFVSRA